MPVLAAEKERLGHAVRRRSRAALWLLLSPLMVLLGITISAFYRPVELHVGQTVWGAHGAVRGRVGDLETYTFPMLRFAEPIRWDWAHKPIRWVVWADGSPMFLSAWNTLYSWDETMVHGDLLELRCPWAGLNLYHYRPGDRSVDRTPRSTR